LIPPSIRPAPLVGLGLLILATAGCGKSPQSAEVNGTVTFDGKPLSGVVVTFYPVVAMGEPRLPFARATTDSAGKFTLTLEGGTPGATIGKNRVIVNWPVRAGHEVKAHPDPFPLPPVYASMSETPFQAIEVKPGPNDIPIDLKRQ
jgi:hypothetical protein